MSSIDLSSLSRRWPLIKLFLDPPGLPSTHEVQSVMKLITVSVSRFVRQPGVGAKLPDADHGCQQTTMVIQFTLGMRTSIQQCRRLYAEETQ
ncbi:hypothetical protein [Aurantimonas sp. 22II-16-19i]|uniref:hypothetical protein n=1 Tax=Aurantimonas sp. 22II-16-19i TaxID=1317114 RepID=UPI00111C6EF2|nr:hypothetical protein [Aurantimonas sp. 22II-16-19i]